MEDKTYRELSLSEDTTQVLREKQDHLKEVTARFTEVSKEKQQVENEFHMLITGILSAKEVEWRGKQVLVSPDCSVLKVEE